MSASVRTTSITPLLARRRRRRLFRGLLAGGLTVAVLAVLAWVALASGLLAVHRVNVRGAHLLSAAQVRAVADVPTGSPLLTLDGAAIRRRLTALPQVAAVRVERDWPTTLTLRLTERTIAAAVTTAAGVDLVAGDGVVVAHAAQAPPKLPLLQLRGAEPTSPTGLAALQVLTALPPSVRDVVVAVAAASPSSVDLALTGKRTVVWGDTTFSARKASVLAALLPHPAAVYDVSSPDVATTR